MRFVTAILASLLLLGLATPLLGQQYPVGTVLRLTAVPDPGHVFVGWSGGITSTSNPVTVTLDSNTAITATFAPEPPPPPPPPPQDVTLTVIVEGNGTVTVEVVPEPPPPPPPPPGSGDYMAEIVCPDASGVYQRTRAIPNDPYGDGCFAAPVDVSVFFTSQPYECATLKPGNFYLGPYPFNDGGAITSRKCVDVRVPEDYKLASGPREQLVAIVHNDLAITDFATQVPYLSNRGELLLLGIPDANGRPPRFTRPGAFQGALINWQATSGNIAVLNLVDIGQMVAGSAHQPIKQTITLAGVSNRTDTRLIIVAYEGGGGSISNDPTLKIDDEVYFKNVLEARARSSHNIYIDRTGLSYIEGLISYGNYGLANHAIKTESRRNYLYGSYLSAVGVHDNLPDDFAGQTPLSGIACSTWVVKDNKLVVAQQNGAGGNSAVSAQVRVAIAGCDYPQGWYSNRYPTSPYTGPVEYNGVQYATTPYWDAAWWNGINGADTYGSPDLLRQFFIGNQFVAIANGTSNPANIVAVLSQPTFPATYASAASTSPIFPADEPPREWVERNRAIMVNNCMTGGGGLTRVAWNGSLTCTWATNPPWVATWPGCVAGEATPVVTDPFVMLGANACGTTDALPAEAQAALDALEAIPNPPWRHW